MEPQIVVRDQPGIAARAVTLASHPDPQASCEVRKADGHATVAFEGYWHSATVSMSHAELEALHAAIGQVLDAEVIGELRQVA